MTIPKQAIDAAAKAIADSIGHGMSEKCFDHARDALTAAAPYMSGVKVKQLEWVEGRTYDGRKYWGSKNGSVYETHPSWTHQGYRVFSTGETFKTLEAAKAAAQADYERRILAAIEAAPPLSKLKAENARLKARLAEAMKALEPFANVAEHDIGGDEDDGDIFWPMSNARYSMAGRLRVGDLRRARTALRERE